MTPRRISFAVLIAAAVTAAPASQVAYDLTVSTCGADARLFNPLPLEISHVELAADGRLFSPCREPGAAEGRVQSHPADHREMRERDVIARAAAAGDSALRRQAVQAWGRLRAPVGTIAPFVTDAAPDVRRAAVRALGAAVRPVVLEPETRHVDVALQHAVEADAGEVYRLLMARLDASPAGAAPGPGVERDETVVGAILHTLGGLPIEGDEPRAAVEALLAGQLVSAGPDRLRGAALGLEVFIRRGGRRPVAESTREQLRAVMRHRTRLRQTDIPRVERVAYGEARRAAMQALGNARDADIETVLTAFHDSEPEVKRMAVARMNAAMPEYAEALETALTFPNVLIRIEAVRAIGRAVGATGDCAALTRALDDVEPVVAVTAMDQLRPACQDPASWMPRLIAFARQLGGSPRAASHRPARALAALARLAPDEAGPLLGDAVSHTAWQVRAAAADIARTLGEEAAVRSLADDPEPNVRTAALRALRALESPVLVEAAIAALGSSDYDLLRTAAGMLNDTPGDRRGDVAGALLSALQRLTDQRWDTSRDPRVAILERLGEVLDPSQASSLITYSTDFDRRVADAAIAAFEALTDAPPVVSEQPRYRYPHQPAVEALASLPTMAAILMEGGGLIELELLGDVAPVSTAQFAELAASGYYNGLTFHRFAPNFVIQGGSPGANEYSGAPRYWRDEIGASNLRGTVGLSTRGHDTADGQIFINLVDNLRLDGDYTVFARVVSGMDVVDRILPGARIERVSVKQGQRAEGRGQR